MEKKAVLLEAYLTQRSVLKRFLVARLGNEEEAEDVVQELWLRLSRVEIAEEVRSPASYLFKIAANLAHDHRRERRRASAREANWVETMHVMAGGEAIADTPEADAAIDAKQRLAALRVVLEELSPQCRRVFVMHKFEGLPHQAIADRVGISRSTVEKHMNTALKHLLKRLNRD